MPSYSIHICHHTPFFKQVRWRCGLTLVQERRGRGWLSTSKFLLSWPVPADRRAHPNLTSHLTRSPPKHIRNPPYLATWSRQGREALGGWWADKETCPSQGVRIMGKTTSNRWCLALRRTCLAPAAAAHPQTSASGVPDRNRSTTSYMKNHKRDFHFYGVEREGEGGGAGGSASGFTTWDDSAVDRP